MPFYLVPPSLRDIAAADAIAANSLYDLIGFYPFIGICLLKYVRVMANGASTYTRLLLRRQNGTLLFFASFFVFCVYAVR